MSSISVLISEMGIMRLRKKREKDKNKNKISRIYGLRSPEKITKNILGHNLMVRRSIVFIRFSARSRIPSFRKVKECCS